MKKSMVRPAAIAAAAVIVAAASPPGQGAEIRRLAARDVKTDFRTDVEATFGRPASVSHDAGAIYVVDAEAHEVRTFSKAGVYLGRSHQ